MGSGESILELSGAGSAQSGDIPAGPHYQNFAS